MSGRGYGPLLEGNEGRSAMRSRTGRFEAGLERLGTRRGSTYAAIDTVHHTMQGLPKLAQCARQPAQSSGGLFRFRGGTSIVVSKCPSRSDDALYMLVTHR